MDVADIIQYHPTYHYINIAVLAKKTKRTIQPLHEHMDRVRSIDHMAQTSQGPNNKTI